MTHSYHSESTQVTLADLRAKVFLPGDVLQHRYDVCRWFLGYPQCTASWFFSYAVWIDPCSSIIPGSYKQYVKMKQLLKRETGCQSDNAKKNTRNRRGLKTALA